MAPRAKEGKGLLFSEEKRSKKDFIHLHPHSRINTRASEQKFFGSFFQKRTASLPSLPPSATIPPSYMGTQA
jgi:hypothetical protein